MVMRNSLDSAANGGSGQTAQHAAQLIGAAMRNQELDFNVSGLPGRVGLFQQRAASRGDNQTAAAFVFLVDRDFQKAAPLQRLQVGGQRRAVHRQQRRDAADARRFRPIERHQQRELSAGEVEGPQCVVEAAAVTVKTEAEANKIFAALASGGHVTMPQAKTFFSPRFGMLTDKFGVNWMVLAE